MTALPTPPPPARPDVGHERLVEWAGVVLREYAGKVRKRARALRREDSVENIHDARVAIRAQRAALEMFEEMPSLDGAALTRLRRRLRPLARSLGTVRDRDVLLDAVDAYARAHPAEAAEVGAFRVELQAERDTFNRSLRRRLDRSRSRRRLRHLRRDIRRALRDGHDQPETTPADNGPLVRHVVGSAIWRRYEGVLAFEPHMPDADAPTLHQLRIACKRLRYVLELFGEDDPRLESLLALFKDAQEQLGTLHDDVNTLAALDAFEAAHPGVCLPGYRHAVEADRDRLCAAAAPLWQRLSGPDTRAELAAFLASL